MKKIRFFFLVVVQIVFASVLTAQTVDTVCVGDIKNYFIDASSPAYSNPSGNFQGGVDTLYLWGWNDDTKGVFQTPTNDTFVTISWIASGDIVLSLTETIQDSLSGVSGMTDCTHTNSLNIHIFDTISNSVLAQPQNAISVLGGSVIFNAGLLVGTPQTFGAITYQWQYSPDGISNWSNIAGANSSILTVNVTQVEVAGYYRCQVFARCNEVITSKAYLSIRGVPEIYLQPQNTTICEGEPGYFTCLIGAICDEGDVLTYQWEMSGSPDGPWEPIIGAVDSFYVIANPQTSSEGYYHCVVNSVAYPEANVISESCFFEVIDNMVIYFTTNNITCNGANNGSILIDSVLNGYAPFTYLWNTGATTNSIEDLTPGSYSVLVTEGSSGCSIEKTVEIDEPLPLQFGIDTSIWEDVQWIHGQDNQLVEDITIDKINHTYYQTGSFETGLNYDGTTVYSNNSGTFDMFVSKISEDGETAWTRHAGGSNDTYGKGVGFDKDGNIYVGGSFQTTICFYNADNTPGLLMTSTGFSQNFFDYDGYIVKYDANGVYQHAITFGSIFNDYIQAIHVEENGQISVTGSFEGDITINGQTISSGSAANVFVARFNHDLSLRWIKAIDNLPSESEHVGNAIVTDVADNTYVSGFFQGENEQLKDLFVARFDYAGDLKWLKTVNGNGILSNAALAVDYSECVYHTGTFVGNAQLKGSDGYVIHNYVSAGGTDGFIQKFDRNGYLRWATTVGGTGNDSINTVATDVLGNTYIAGNFSGSISFNNHTFNSTPNASNSFVAKYSNVEASHPYTTSIPSVWGNVIDGMGYQNVKTIAVDNDQNILIGGNFTIMANFGDSISVEANYPQDAFVARLKDTYEQKVPIIVDAFCPEDPSGSIQLFIAGGTLPYDYVWSIEGDTSILNNIESGRYWYWIGDYYNTWDDSVCGFNGSIYINHIHNAPAKPNYLTVDHNDFCAGSFDQITLSAHTIPTNITDSIFWIEGDCFTGNSIEGTAGHPADNEYTLAIPAPTDTTTYYAYWVSEFCGRSLCASITVNVKPLPVIPESIIVDTNNFCTGTVDTVRFTAVGGSGRILEWLSTCSDSSYNIIGTGSHFSTVAPLDSTTFYVRWKNDCGISECQSIMINVIPYPNATIYELNEEYCSNDAVDTLIGMPAEGTWNGPGITVISANQAVFNPSLAPAGYNEITYTVNYGGCDSTYVAGTTIYASPETDFTGLDSVYCFDAANVLLTGNYAPHGTFSCSIPNALEDIGYGKAMFKPTVAGVGGPYAITYTYEDINTGCIDSITKTTKVIRPSLAIEGLPEETCSNEEYLVIHGLIDSSYYGGTFTGIGISGHLEQGVALFDPNLDPGVYTITLTYTNYLGCTVSMSQTIRILESTIVPDTVFVLGGTTAYCYQSVDSLILVTEGGFGETIEWYQENCGNAASLIDTGSQIQVAAPHENVSYFVRWSNSCGASECLELPITVYELPKLSVSGNFAICSNDSTTILADENSNFEYFWQIIETGDIVGQGYEIVLAPDVDTWYRLIAQNENDCVDSIDFLITVSEPPALELGEDLYLLSCDSVEITAGDGIGFDNYLWQDNSTEPTLWITETGVYTVTVYNDGCSITDSVFVELCSDKFFIPNAFSPNGDGLNDNFRPKMSDLTLKAEMYIYARNGSLIFQTENIMEGWDGTDMKGAECPNGTYAYLIKYHIRTSTGRTLDKSAAGAVILMR